MKRWIAFLCSALLLWMGSPVSTVSADAAQTLTFGQMHGRYRTLGRAAEHGNSLYMDNTASGFELYFYGSGDVTVNAAVVCSTEGEIAQYLTVVVDGVRSRVRVECETLHTVYQKSIRLASGLPEGYHHMEVYRQTEAQVSNFCAHSLTFTGRLLAAPTASPLTIDVVGDSISGGYGTLWNSSLGVAAPACNHPKYEDGTKTYAFLAGKALGADVRVVQSSGYGCVAGWNGRNVNLQTMYPYLNWFRSSSYLNPFDPLADIVIINLGTNDYSTRNNNNMTNAEFQAGAKNLMQMAKQYNPGATVIWCTGMMGSYYSTEVKAAIAELGGAAAGYYFLELPRGQGGAVSHPNEAQQEAAGKVLLNFLKTTVLPADYTAATASVADVQAVIREASAVSHPSAALTGALTRAQVELAVNTTDPYRLRARLDDVRRAMNGDVTVSLMPKQHISETPTASDGVSFVWPYYSDDGSVSLYKGGEGSYWPQINTAHYFAVDIDETPYLYVDYGGNAEYNVSITYRRPDGELAYVNIPTLMGSNGVDLPASERTTVKADFGAYIRKLGHADSEGLVPIVRCDMYVVGATDTWVRVFDCAFTSAAPEEPTLTLSGAYPVNDGYVTGLPAGMTAAELIGAMDNSEQLSLKDKNGNVVTDGVIASGMVLELAKDGIVLDSAVLAVVGDLNGDGAVSSVDARTLLMQLLGVQSTDDPLVMLSADMDGDGQRTTGDVRAILKSAL